MYKSLLPILFTSLFLISCNETPDTNPANTPEKQQTQAEVKNASKPQNAIDIDGKYASKEGELELKSSKDKTNTHFSILVVHSVVNSEARIGEVEGDFTLNDNNQASYKAKDCALQFTFSESTATVKQKGLCEMGLNVTASGVYKK